MLRNILAVLAGVVLASSVVFGIESIGHLIYPLPEGLDSNDYEELKAYIPMMPFGAFLFILLAHSFGAFFGSFLSSKIAKSSKFVCGYITGMIILCFSILNIFMIFHPIWFAITDIVLYFPVTYFGAKLGSK